MIRLAACAVLLAPAAGAAPFDIVFTSAFPPTDAQAALAADAEFFWESLVTGYRPGIEVGALTIDVGVFYIDGPDGTLAYAEPTAVVEQAGFVLPTEGYVDFDRSDVEMLEAEGLLFQVLLHEVAHVMGIGTLWAENGLLSPDGDYVGAAGLAAYRTEFDPTADFVPVEREGGEGTAYGHWAENWPGGYEELMTGYLDAPFYLSETTVASLRDLGYETAPVPLPAGGWLLLAGLGLMGAARRR